MEDYITVSAKTLDDAITEALVQLGVTSDRLDYIVVEKGSEGFVIWENESGKKRDRSTVS